MATFHERIQKEIQRRDAALAHLQLSGSAAAANVTGSIEQARDYVSSELDTTRQFVKDRMQDARQAVHAELDHAKYVVRDQIEHAAAVARNQVGETEAAIRRQVEHAADVARNQVGQTEAAIKRQIESADDALHRGYENLKTDLNPANIVREHPWGATLGAVAAGAAAAPMVKRYFQAPSASREEAVARHVAVEEEKPAAPGWMHYVELALKHLPTILAAYSAHVAARNSEDAAATSASNYVG